MPITVEVTNLTPRAKKIDVRVESPHSRDL